MDDLLSDIEAFCRVHDIRESRFGRDAVNDTTFVAQIRGGREPRRSTEAKVRAFMAMYRAPATQQMGTVQCETNDAIPVQTCTTVEKTGGKSFEYHASDANRPSLSASPGINREVTGAAA